MNLQLRKKLKLRDKNWILRGKKESELQITNPDLRDLKLDLRISHIWVKIVQFWLFSQNCEI